MTKKEQNQLSFMNISTFTQSFSKVLFNFPFLVDNLVIQALVIQTSLQKSLKKLQLE